MHGWGAIGTSTRAGVKRGKIYYQKIFYIKSVGGRKQARVQEPRGNMWLLGDDGNIGSLVSIFVFQLNIIVTT